ncbi:MAG: glycoside hydrolase family protein [Armatimonadota bacterium]|nr:glycoside hydrolase family protein [Armatimonadota bacterium]
MIRPLIERLLPVPRDSRFKMPGFFVWCGSLIRAGGRYHLFASRWPEATGFPDGYRAHSEIVRATAPTPTGPFTFQEVVLAGRGGRYWDGQMCHNPKVVPVGQRFVLYYIGSARGSALRQIGWAVADSIEGPWQRADEPLALGEDANNPAPYVHEDGSILLAYRDQHLRMHVARALSCDGSYSIIAEDIFPQGRLEDPDLFFLDGRYHLVMEDNEGKLTGAVRHGGHLISEDGVRWVPHDPPRVYSHTIEWEDGTRVTATRRERPEVFNAHARIKGNGEPTHLMTAVLIEGQSWCLIQPIAAPDGEQ